MLRLPAQRCRPVPHRPAVRAEDPAQRQPGHHFQRRDERGQILVLAQVAQALGQEQVPREQPSALALEEARVVRAVPGGVDHLEAERSGPFLGAERLRVDPRRPAPRQTPVRFLVRYISRHVKQAARKRLPELLVEG